MQALEEAQETNRRLNRRVQRAERTYESMVGKAQQETRYAQEHTSRILEQSKNLIAMNHSAQISREKDFRGLTHLFWMALGFFWWGVIATGCAIYFYFH